MAGLDSFLNFFVPALIIGFFAFMIYKGVKPQADAFFKWIGETIKNMREEETNTTGYKSVIVYE